MQITEPTPFYPTSGFLKFTLTYKDVGYLLLYITILALACFLLPKQLWFYYETRSALIGFGFLGIWRYSWWLLHIIRSMIYAHIVFPKRRAHVDRLWQQGNRPKKIFFMLTTFKEKEATTRVVLQSILDEVTAIDIPTQLYIGYGCEHDAEQIKHFFAHQKVGVEFNVTLVKQRASGKRSAIADTLRIMIKDSIKENDPVIFMDGDTYLTPGTLQKCLPFFLAYPKLQALTTYEEAILLNGPEWMKKWLQMRFAQRHFTMQSYALSNKVLTLTGRMSIFRAKHILEKAFIEIIENDHLNHWLWGRFRFLSGDDKSTWYYLLKHRAHMFYVPDATTITIEHIKGSPLTRMVENLRRWSGNTLRNGARAIALGPKCVGFFIWWCLIDQRISIWTLFIGHSIALVLAFSKSYAFLLLTVIWLGFSRLCIATVLFFHARRIDMSFPFLIYINQLASSLIKIYILFRLPQQRWQNRGEQQLGFDNTHSLQHMIAHYLTACYCLAFLLFVLLYLKLIRFPTCADFWPLT